LTYEEGYTKEPEGKKYSISFSRFEWWNREKKAYAPTNPDNHIHLCNTSYKCDNPI
jgi:hypothetical protein